jgi:hypothetical protein
MADTNPLLAPEQVVDGHPLSLGVLLKKDHLIPDYQRDFVWKEKTVKQLWDDLISHFARNSDGVTLNQMPEGPDGYFMGALVVMPNKGAPSEVIDGQQRIVTFNCLISVLRDRWLAIADTASPEFSAMNNWLTGMLGDAPGGTWVSNLTFKDNQLSEFACTSMVVKEGWQQKQDYWENNTLAIKLLGNKAGAASRLREAMTVCNDQLTVFLDHDAISVDDKVKRLYSFVNLLGFCTIFLEIEASSHSTAYTIFESLNNRGIPLNQADLIKNELLKVSTGNDKGETSNAWAMVKDTLAERDISLPDFIHFSYLSRHGHCTAAKLFDAVKKLAANSVQAKTYVTELVDDAAALEELYLGNNVKWDAETNQMLKDLCQVLNVKFAYPYLLAAHKKHGATKAEFRKHVKILMSFIFRYMKVLEGDVGALAKGMSKAAGKIVGGAKVAEISKLLLPMASDEEFCEAFRTKSFKNTKLAYFVVYYVEASRLSGSLPVEHGKEQNLEHIMPKNPSKKDWPQAKALKDSDPGSFREYLWMPGNLLPLPEGVNKSIQNKGIAHKISNPDKKDYRSTSLASTKDIKTYLEGKKKWTIKSISNRQSDITDKYILKAWPL